MRLAFSVVACLLTAACVSTSGERGYDHRPLAEQEVLYRPVVTSNAPAIIHVMRDARVWGGAMAPMLLVNGEEIAHISNGSALTLELDPGQHLIGIRSLGNDMVSPFTLGIRRPTEIIELELNAASDGQYFFRIETRAGDEFSIQRTSN